MKKEITIGLSLSREQRILLNSHSFLNLINVLADELHYLRELAHRKEAFDGTLQVIKHIRHSLEDDSPAMITPHQMQEFYSYIEQEIAAEVQEGHLSNEQKKKFNRSTDNIRSIFRIIHIRVRELMARSDESETWTSHPISQIMENLHGFLAAIEKNSKGSYRIVHSENHKEDSDYLITLQIKSPDKKNIFMPPVVQDFLYDLIANARKYTRPGGCIHALLEEDPEKILFQITDTGIGIPEDEIEQVVTFGYRAGNAIDKKTHGGGFGLTKAYYHTREMGGRMWIASTVSRGTTITIHIPKNSSDSV